MINQYRNGIALQYNVPLWVGEFGENSNYWGNGIKEFFNRNEIGWSWWNFKSVERISSLFSYKITDEYQKLINYWGGTAAKPDTAEAFAALMSMARNLHFDSCRVNIGLTRALSDTTYNSENKSSSHDKNSCYHVFAVLFFPFVFIIFLLIHFKNNKKKYFK